MEMDLLLDFVNNHRLTAPPSVDLAHFPEDQWDHPTLADITNALSKSDSGLSHNNSGEGDFWLTEEPHFPVTLAFKTGSGAVGVLQITGLTEKPRGAKIRYKLVKKGGPAESHAATAPSLTSEPPKLQFLAWQDQWETNQPGAARHPDGSPVTNATELAWLNRVYPVRVDVGSWKIQPPPRFLHLWFSHSLFDSNSVNEVELLDDDGEIIPPGAVGSLGANAYGTNQLGGDLGWLTHTFSPKTGLDRATIRLRYTIGPLESAQEVDVTPNQTPPVRLEGGSQFESVGQNAQGRATLAVSENRVGMPSRKFGVVAITKDGSEMAAKGWVIRGGNVKRVETYEFDTPLTNIARFRIGTRRLWTCQWTNVALPEVGVR